MGKPTGFMEFERALPIVRLPHERLNDWNEFHYNAPEDVLQKQGARCMDCGVPFCQSGLLIGGSASGCPVNNLIPEWNDLVYRGDWRKALDLLHETNNFPEFTGRVCPAPCEGSCVLGINNKPVTIKSIECAIVDNGFDQGWILPEPPVIRSGKKVAIVGSGPAGLACAAQLNKHGHLVTVFERSDRIGGLLMYGIPNMKLEKWRVQRRVDLLKAEGITFLTNVEVGKDYPLDKLRSDFDAVVVCAGATKPRDLEVPNRTLSGVYFAMEFLKANTKSYLDSNHVDGEFINARDRDVVVIGGGDTGTDCVATALRQGCRSLVQFEILARPTPRRTADNPWPQWPRVHRTDYGHTEARHLHGEDPRRFGVRTLEFVSNGASQVTAVRTIEMGAGESVRDLPAQIVLLALGFTGPEPGLPTTLGLPLNSRGTLQVDENKMTNLKGIFAAGDVERGQSLVVWAIADGRRAAQGVHDYLATI